MDKLTDFMREDYEDVGHVFFPGMPLLQVMAQWDAYSHRYMPEFSDRISAYIAELRVPDPGEVVTTAIFPDRILNDLAHSIDTNMPHWNLVQRSILYTRMATQLYRLARHWFEERIDGAAAIVEKNFSDSIISQALQGND